MLSSYLLTRLRIETTAAKSNHRMSFTLSYGSGLNLLKLMVSLLNYISFLALKEHTSIN